MKIEKQEFIRQKLKETPEKSDRRISRETGIDHKTISAYRKKLESAGEIPRLETTIGMDGRRYPRQKNFQDPPSRKDPGPETVLMPKAGEKPEDKPQTKRCSKCGRILPLTAFSRKKDSKDGHQYTCRECRKLVTFRQDTDAKGKPYEIAPELRGMTREEVIGNLYDRDRVIEFTLDDFKEEIDALTTTYMESATMCLELHEDLLKDKKSRERILGGIFSLLSDEMKKWKEAYNYEGISI